MLILGIDTATPQAGCAIGGHEGVLASTHAAEGRRHAENLIPSIKFICERAQVELSDIGVIAVDCGPGLFTGLRVGIATAKSLAQALGIPMIGVSSLDLVAFPARYSNKLITSVVDARRGEVYYAFYRQVPGGVQRLSEPQLGTPQDLASELMARGEDVLLVGDGAERYRDEFRVISEAEVADRGSSYPLASSLVQLAHAKAMREEFVRPEVLVPLYLRKPDAEINWQTRATG